MPLTSIVATLDAACTVIANPTKARRKKTARATSRGPRMGLLLSTGYMPVAT